MKITFNASTLLWTTKTKGTFLVPVLPPTLHAVASGPFTCEAVQLHLNFDGGGLFDDGHGAWYPNGGSFYKVTSGTYNGKYVYMWTNERGYGDITVTADAPAHSNPELEVGDEPIQAHIDPLADWRILIKGMAGGSGAGLEVPDGTLLWHLGTTGRVIMPPYEHTTTAGTYSYESIMVPLNFYANSLSEDQAGAWYPNGGSFYKITSGPYTGKLVYKWSKERGYGDIVATEGTGSGAARGPGATLATLYRPNAHLAGASLNYNAPGELHFTLLVDDPNVRVPVPKKTHYAVEFWNGSAWEEVFAGLIWDMDATETEVVYYGIDYLGLLQYIVDERYNPSKVDAPPPTGSKYVGKSIKYIINDLLYYAMELENSPVGFILYGSIPDEMDAVKISGIYSTFANVLDFSIGLINSYRAGSGKMTRLKVVKVGSDYKFRIDNDPGVARDGMPLVYGGLAQGYRVIPFGKDWASRVNLISRQKDGLKVHYRSESGAALQSEWGRICQGPVLVETEDKNDLRRRALQAATDAAAFGRQIGVGLKLGSFRPLEGYDVCDYVPVDINHGAVDTMSWGSDVFGQELLDQTGYPVSSGYWAILGIAWESYDDGHWITNLSLFPKNHVPPPTGCLETLPEGYYPPNGSNLSAGTGTTHYYKAGAGPPTVLTPGWAGDWHFPNYHVTDSEVEAGYRDEASSDVGNICRLILPGSGKATVYTRKTSTDQSNLYMDFTLNHLDPLGGVVEDWHKLNVKPGDTVEVVVDDADVCEHYLNIRFDTRGGTGLIGYGGFDWLPYTVYSAVPATNYSPQSTGYGPPDPSNQWQGVYLDLVTGIQYERDPDDNGWVAIPGTGYTASGIFDFTFASSTVWVITHSVGGYPRVTLRDATGQVIEADIVYNSETQITITFSSAVSGSAHLG